MYKMKHKVSLQNAKSREMTMTTIFKWIYELSYRFTKPNWDEDTIPSQVAALPAPNGQGGRALDLGCGTGTQAIFLAQQGYKVVGIDFSQKAIALASEKARQAGAGVDFRLGDVTRLNFLHEPFDVVLDVGCFHGLSEAERKRYADNLARLTCPGSQYVMWAMQNGGHFGLGTSPEEVGRLFSPNFVLERAEKDNAHNRPSTWYWLSRV
jgi:2-polyprenyl-3-methyl-5-hydroxy-6-metoxy-1,4-benzoquinol methylase